MNRVRACFALCMLPLILGATGHSPEPPQYTPTSEYRVENIDGWTVRINPALGKTNPRLEKETLRELENQLYRITRVIPPAALERIRDIEVWVELDTPKTACMCYHVSKGWLIPNGYNPDKEGAIEIGNARAFVDWTQGQPWMVLHELAHGYHDKVFGYDHAGISQAWQRMSDGGTYEKVGHISGRPRRHYALVNPMEYFSETTEAIYGRNDFHPYVRSELEKVDPEGMALVKSLWELDPVPPDIQ